MVNYLLAGGLGGILLAVMDGLLNANPAAIKLLAAFKPIARPSLSVAAGILIDLAFGFSLAALFTALRPAFPTSSGLLNGLIFGAGVWLLRTVMPLASQQVMFAIPLSAAAYQAGCGLLEMLVLGILFGLVLAA